MYESPIEIIIGKIQTQMEDDVVKAVQSFHINVDKDEIVKALRYDRDQYNMGYNDGRRSLLRHGEWIYEKAADVFICSKCGGAMVRNTYFYCPWCGARMRGDTE